MGIHRFVMSKDIADFTIFVVQFGFLRQVHVPRFDCVACNGFVVFFDNLIQHAHMQMFKV